MQRWKEKEAEADFFLESPDVLDCRNNFSRSQRPVGKLAANVAP
jgi:hypothetical protein